MVYDRNYLSGGQYPGRLYGGQWMIVVDNNDLNIYGRKEIISQDLVCLIKYLNSSLLMDMHTEIIKELKKREEQHAENNTDN